MTSRPTPRAAAAATIHASDLDSILSLASVPLSYALRGASAPAPADRTEAQARIERMRALDTQRLKEKVAKGDADEEQVTALVKEMCAWPARAPCPRPILPPPAQRLLTHPPTHPPHPLNAMRPFQRAT